MTGRVVKLLSFLAMTPVFACGSSSSPPGDSAAATVRFVGVLPGTDVQMAAVTSEHHARLYFCGGDTSYATSTKWLVAPLDGAGAIALGPPDSPWRLRATVVGGSLQGSIDRGDGLPAAFSAERVSESSLTGLYEANAPCGKVGVIVTQASGTDAAAVQGACIPTDSTVPIVQVNPLLPVALQGDGSLGVTPAGTTETAFVRAAAPPLD
jgi:hypothetical protein